MLRLASYEEGIGVLYATNTFLLSGDYLLTHLQDYILPARLAAMNSFEINLTTIGSLDQVPFQPKTTTLKPLLRVLAESTNVKRLYMVLSCPQLSKVPGNMDVAHLIREMDGFVRRVNLESCILQVDVSILRQLENSVPTPDIDLSSRSGGADGTTQLWRIVHHEPEQSKTEKRTCRYPETLAPTDFSADSEPVRCRGYWILRSYDEVGPLRLV